MVCKLSVADTSKRKTSNQYALLQGFCMFFLPWHTGKQSYLYGSLEETGTDLRLSINMFYFKKKTLPFLGIM